jgi:molybdopterin-guanine dinucleotide biosynthesis protein A
VLAGGASQRMGVDKAGVRVDGVPMAARVGAALGAVCGRVVVVRRESDSAPIVGVDGTKMEQVIGTEGPDRHPLWGVAVAGDHARGDWVIVAPCDLPWLSGAVVEALWTARGDHGAVASDGQQVHPLLAVLRSGHARQAGEAARAGGSARAFVAGLGVVVVGAEALRNVNSPENLPVARPR